MVDMSERRLVAPATPVPPGPGMLRKEQSHIGYVTNDLDRAMSIFRERYGVGDFTFIEGPMQQGGHIRVAFAWAGSQIYEIIQASGAEAQFYNDMLPEVEFAISFHHLGFVIHDDESWRQLEAEIAGGDWSVALSTVEGNFIDAYYVYAPELGHYLEYVRPHEAGLNFYDAVPVN
jgi:hypothetical protein